jgi:N-sulfoglucosamine sulfohydrolase
VTSKNSSPLLPKPRRVRYTRVFTTVGVSAPSRAALITGQHQISFSAQHMRRYNEPAGKYFAQPGVTVREFPELLRAQDYFTYTDQKLDYQFSGIRAGSAPFSICDQEGADSSARRERDEGQPSFGMINFMVTD